MAHTSIALTLISFLGCSSPPNSAAEGSLAAGGETDLMSGSTRRGPENWPVGFPAMADLAILLDTLDTPVVDTRTLDLNGDSLFPEAWLRAVQDAFSGTDVMDALQVENTYDDWRLVSIRVSPCAPLGVTPRDDIDTWCWPTVRLVWQPVVENFQTLWGTYVDFYADDRAVHAIYPVAARDRSGLPIEGSWREVVSQHLADGNSPESLDPRMTEGFAAVRDATSEALLEAVLRLRSEALSSGDFADIDVRPELWSSDQVAEAYKDRLRSFLSEFASWQSLEELTAFSLPEGRNPAGSDIWVFVGFEGRQGFPRLKELNVIGRETGTELVRIGTSQTVAVGVEDTAIERALDSGNTELRESLVIDGDDIARLGPDMADPYEFLVPNTSCASCHRLNGLRFDFHSLSGFEDRGITVSPRVRKDVARDISWTRKQLLP